MNEKEYITQPGENSGNVPWQPYTSPEGSPSVPQLPPRPFFPVCAREIRFAGITLLTALSLCNFVIFGGFNLGFAIAAVACILCQAVYLLASGNKLTGYSGALLTLSIVIAASFARSDDGFVKFVMLCFLAVSGNLGLCLLAGQNRRDPSRAGSLADAGYTVFCLGVGKLPEATRGLRMAFHKSGPVGRKGGAVVLGLVIALPVLAVLIPLLIHADAAFAGLVARLPVFDFKELAYTLLFGTGAAWFQYTRGAALRHNPKRAPAVRNPGKGLSAITVGTVLGAVCSVYFVYLVSQLAYFVGGFAGILPEAYTAAEYARRGFFEMAWLCAINLGIMTLSMRLVRKEKEPPFGVRLLCLFIGIVTLFLVAAASAKMLLYIRSFGLTRLRVLTEVIMLWLGLTTFLVTIWLFYPKLPYMKLVLLAALLIGGAVSWADVDTQVARYNVTAYQAGKLETVDVWYLNTLSDGVVPYLQSLTQDDDPDIAAHAQYALELRGAYVAPDFRGWNYVNQEAKEILDSEKEVAEFV